MPGSMTPGSGSGQPQAGTQDGRHRAGQSTQANPSGRWRRHLRASGISWTTKDQAAPASLKTFLAAMETARLITSIGEDRWRVRGRYETREDKRRRREEQARLQREVDKQEASATAEPRRVEEERRMAETRPSASETPVAGTVVPRYVSQHAEQARSVGRRPTHSFRLGRSSTSTPSAASCEHSSPNCRADDHYLGRQRRASAPGWLFPPRGG